MHYVVCKLHLFCKYWIDLALVLFSTVSIQPYKFIWCKRTFLFKRFWLETSCYAYRSNLFFFTSTCLKLTSVSPFLHEMNKIDKKEITTNSYLFLKRSFTTKIFFSFVCKHSQHVNCDMTDPAIRNDMDFPYGL